MHDVLFCRRQDHITIVDAQENTGGRIIINLTNESNVTDYILKYEYQMNTFH